MSLNLPLLFRDELCDDGHGLLEAQKGNLGVTTACINTSTDTAYTDIHVHNNNVLSLGLEQQHEKLCSNNPRGHYRMNEYQMKRESTGYSALPLLRRLMQRYVQSQLGRHAADIDAPLGHVVTHRNTDRCWRPQHLLRSLCDATEVTSQTTIDLFKFKCAFWQIWVFKILHSKCSFELIKPVWPGC